jgi:hypothetical protein
MVVVSDWILHHLVAAYEVRIHGLGLTLARRNYGAGRTGVERERLQERVRYRMLRQDRKSSVLDEKSLETC